jgi:hypothetical protein
MHPNIYIKKHPTRKRKKKRTEKGQTEKEK